MSTVAHGGSAPFTVAARAEALIERRTLPGEDAAAALSEVRALVDAVTAGVAGLGSTVELVLARDAWQADDRGPAAELMDLLADALPAAGAAPPARVGAPYWMESALWQASGVPAVVCGPAGGGLHAVDEWVDLAQLRRYPVAVAGAVGRFLAGVSRVTREAYDPRDPLGLAGDAPLLDGWLRFGAAVGAGTMTPFTIPGHKQRTHLVGDVVRGDVPLYAGLDTMKQDGGLLARAEQRAAAAWGVDWGRLSVAGATHANQAAMLALGGPGQERRHHPYPPSLAAARHRHGRTAARMGPAEGEHGGLIGVRRAGDRQPAPVHAPGGRRPLLGPRQQPAVLLHRVKARVQRHVTAHHVAHQVGALLVAGDRERRHGARTDGGAEPQPAVKQRRVTRQAKRVPGIVGFARHPAHPARKRPTAAATATG